MWPGSVRAILGRPGAPSAADEERVSGSSEPSDPPPRYETHSAQVTNWRPNAEFGLVPEWLGEVADTVLADLQQPIPIDVLLGYESDTQTLWVSEAGHRGRSGFGLLDEHRGVELLVALADWLQEQFFPETHGAWGEARPECPNHPHPAHAVEIAGEAWWVCPVEGHQIAAIGQLAQ